MKLDPRLRPGVLEEMRGSRSSASTPSLRSRDATPNANFGGNVKVVVRVRGFLPREIQRGAKCLVRMDPETEATKLLAPDDTDPANSRSRNRRVAEEKEFTFDKSFWSHNIKDAHYADQEYVYQALGEELLDANFEGYNTCIFAYGQTGSGKSYTMMGTPDAPGLIPRTCTDLFERIEANEHPNLSHHLRVSYFEVYNEHIRDLLVEPSESHFLRVKEHPIEGPFIKDLREVSVKSLSEIMKYMSKGDSHRTTASTKMNDTSSRSHAVFTIMMKQICHDLETDETTERTAQIRLVDLAGSERASATGAEGTRLREGSNINKSLSTLGRVIAALADPKRNRAKKNSDVVPYRDSCLTWLLKDSLSGNSKTAMIACIAPSDYDETLSTLRYADQAKNIRTKAKVNEDSKSKAERDQQLADLEETIRRLNIQHSYSDEELHRKAEERLEQYKEQVKMLMRKHEDASEIQDNKMQAIMAQNEALKIHLKLAVENMKNPIVLGPTVQLYGPPVCDENGNVVYDELETLRERQENPDPEDDQYWEDWANQGLEEREEKDKDLHYYMKELMIESGRIKKKIEADIKRFGPLPPPGTWPPPSLPRKVFAERVVN